MSLQYYSLCLGLFSMVFVFLTVHHQESKSVPSKDNIKCCMLLSFSPGAVQKYISNSSWWVKLVSKLQLFSTKLPRYATTVSLHCSSPPKILEGYKHIFLPQLLPYFKDIYLIFQTQTAPHMISPLVEHKQDEWLQKEITLLTVNLSF